MKNSKKKHIALIEIANDGHRTAYMRLFIASLIVQEYKVLCLIPNPEPIREWIDEHYPKFRHKVTYKSFSYRWNAYKIPYLGERLLVLSNLLKIKKLVREFENSSQQSVEFLFFNYIDKFLVNFVPLFLLNIFFQKKWGALLIHSGTYRIYPNLLNRKATIKSTDHIFNSKKCIGLAVHDENIITALNNRLNTQVILFPEIADLTAPDYNHQTYLTIKEKAKGRKIIGAIGFEPHKCGYEFLQLAKTADPGKYFFAFLGVFNDHVKSAYTDDQRQDFETFFSSVPENSFVSLGHIDEGQDYNSIFCSFDIIFLMYHDFYNASNRLTKAAHFQKLVLTTNLGCIGDDVKNYQLGEVVENTLTSTLAQLEKLSNRIDSEDFPIENWKIYSKMHHTDILKEKFKLLFN